MQDAGASIRIDCCCCCSVSVRRSCVVGNIASRAMSLVQCGRCLYSAVDASTVRQMPLQCGRCLYGAADASTVRQMPLQCGRCLYSAADTSTVRQMPLQCGRCLYSAVGGTFRPSVFWRAGLLTDKLPNIFAILFIRGFPFCLGPLLSWNFFLPAVLFFLKYKRGETGKTGNVPLYQETEQRAKHQER